MVKSRLKYLIILSAFLVIVSLAGFYVLFIDRSIHPVGVSAVVFIPEGSKYEQAMDSIKKNLAVKNESILDWVAKRKNYPVLIKPGKYVINKYLSYNQLINIFRGGKQTPLRITFNNIRTINELAGKIGGQIEADSAEISNFFSDPDNYREDGFNKENVISVFIPDTYEFFWNTSARKLYNRMLREYKDFWNNERIMKSEEIGLIPVEVSVLASIVDQEATKQDEKPRIAGVYINRLKRGIPLQADPTVKFAINDFTVNRILYKHLEIDSPYNTYKHSGLPPGPIGCPSVEGIDAVLNAEKHDYLYFAAKPDFSGYHNFSRTLAEHNRYASQYQKELNKRRIFK